MSKIVSIHQPNYLPWTGFFNKIASSDIFVIFDDVQFPRGKKNNFANRNRIKTNGGAKWLTIPILEKNEFKNTNEIFINNKIAWKEQHWNMIDSNYHKTEFFSEVSQSFQDVYNIEWEKLIDLNVHIIKKILEFLDINTEIKFASEFTTHESGTERIIELIKINNGTQYLTGTGPGSSRYVKGFENEFSNNGIEIIEHAYEIVEYNQLFGNFIPGLSIIDMLFNLGLEKTSKIVRKNF